MRSPKTLRTRGFSLIEVLITSVVIASLAGFGVVMGTDGYKNYLFHAEEQMLIALLSQARSHSLNNIFETSHGIHITPSAYILFRGNIYTAGAPTNENTPRNTAITVTGLSDIVFTQLAGDVASPGTITLNDGFRSRTITINTEGRINW